MNDERVTLRRTFAVDIDTDGDGRTLTGRCVPYGVRATVRDPGGASYPELFQRGAFRHMARAARRVLLRFEHREGIADTVGYATDLDDRPDGLWARFRILSGQAGDAALELIDARVLTGLSVGFVPLTRVAPMSDGTIVRTRCHLDEVSLCREAAYGESELAVRDGDALASLPLVAPWPELRPSTDPDLDARIAALLAPASPA